MAFNIKVSVVLLVQLVVAEVSAESAGGRLNFCTECKCREESGTTKCYRYERKAGGCPLVCGSSCICKRSIPPICMCTHGVETCSPEQCPQNTAPKLENLSA